MRQLMRYKLHRLSIKLMVLALLPSTSFAASLTSVLDNAAQYLQGGVARSVGVIAIVTAGYLCIFKQMFPKMYFAMIVVGMGLIFGASEIYAFLAG